MPISPPRLSRAVLLAACCLSFAPAGAAFGQAPRLVGGNGSPPVLTPPPAPITADALRPGTQAAPLPDVEAPAGPQAGPSAEKPGHEQPGHEPPGHPKAKRVVYYHHPDDAIGCLEGMCLTARSKILQMQAQPKYLDDYLRCLRDTICPWWHRPAACPPDPYGVYGYGYGYGGNAFVPAGYAPPAAGHAQGGHGSPYGRIYDPLTGRMNAPGHGAPIPFRQAPGFPPGGGHAPSAPGAQPPTDRALIDARLNLPSMGGHSVAYPTNPHYFDPRDGRIYAAPGYGQPVAQPLAPNVEMIYNYSHGSPGSRLTPVSRMPAPQP